MTLFATWPDLTHALFLLGLVGVLSAMVYAVILDATQPPRA